MLVSRIEAKNKIQSSAVKLSKKHRFICLEWSTGTGKTLAAAKIVNEILKDNPDATGYLLCKEGTHKKNWIKDLEKHGMNNVIDASKIMLYGSLATQKKKADYVILDECHALTPLKIKRLRAILQKGVRLIFLSATLPDNKRALMLDLCKEIYFDKISLSKAIKLGLLPQPKLVVHKIHLSNDGEAKWPLIVRKAGKKDNVMKTCSYKNMNNTLNSYPRNIGVTIMCNEKEYYLLISKRMDYYYDLSEDYEKPYKLREGCRHKWLNLATQRKKFIAEVKTGKVQELVEQFREEKTRFLCFTGTVKQALELGSDQAIHSKNSDDANEAIIDCFNSHECDEIFAVKKLREGANLDKIEKGIITQLDSTAGSFFQMLGKHLPIFI